MRDHLSYRERGGNPRIPAPFSHLVNCQIQPQALGISTLSMILLF